MEEGSLYKAFAHMPIVFLRCTLVNWLEMSNQHKKTSFPSNVRCCMVCANVNESFMQLVENCSSAGCKMLARLLASSWWEEEPIILRKQKQIVFIESHIQILHQLKTRIYNKIFCHISPSI